MIRILVADDHAIVRQGLRALLERQDDLQVVGEAADGRQAVALVRELQPNVAVLDIAMPEMNGAEAIRQIEAEFSGRVLVVALSMHADRAIVQDALVAGARAYVVKEAAYEELVAAIRAVHTGRHYLSPRIADVVVQDYVRFASADDARPSSKLTGREREVWQLLAEGNASQEIAERLFISVRTVETHRQRLMEKLGARTVADLTRMAIREGLVSA